MFPTSPTQFRGHFSRDMKILALSKGSVDPLGHANIWAVQNYAPDAIKRFEVFFKVILCGMSMPGSSLYRICGAESIRRHIGSYLGFSFPSVYFQAAVNIGFDLFWPFSRPKKFAFDVEIEEVDLSEDLSASSMIALAHPRA